MSAPEPNTLWLHDRVERLRDGDRDAGNELLQAVAGRMERLARRMLRDFPKVRPGADTGDVVNGAMLRVINALRDVRPGSTREFAGLAALQVRRELLDLARYHSVRGAGARLPEPRTEDFGVASSAPPD